MRALKWEENDTYGRAVSNYSLLYQWIQDKGTKGSIKGVQHRFILSWHFRASCPLCWSCWRRVNSEWGHDCSFQAYPDQLAECNCNVKPCKGSLSEQSMCEMEQNYFSPEKNSRVHAFFFFCIAISMNLIIAQSHQSWSSIEKHWAFPQKPHLTKTESIPKGVFHKAELARLLLSSISMHDWILLPSLIFTIF